MVSGKEDVQKVEADLLYPREDKEFRELNANDERQRRRGQMGEALNTKVLYGEAPPRGPNPYPFIYHF